MDDIDGICVVDAHLGGHKDVRDYMNKYNDNKSWSNAHRKRGIAIAPDLGPGPDPCLMLRRHH